MSLCSTVLEQHVATVAHSSALRAGMLCSISSAVTSGTLLKGRIFFPRRSATETDIDIMRTRC